MTVHAHGSFTVLIGALLLAGCSSSTVVDESAAGDVGGSTGSGGTAGTGGKAPGSGGAKADASTGTGGAPRTDGGSGGKAGAKVDAGSGGAPGSGGARDAAVRDGGKIVLGGDGKLTIWTIGDSITNNNEWRARMCTVLTGQGYVPWFVGSLKGGGTCNQGDNDGHSGFTIANILNGNAGSGTVDDWYAGINKPQVATLMIGTNDVAWWVAAGSDMAVFADNAIALAEHILGLDPDMYLMVGTIPPESSSVVAAINRDRADLTNEYNAALKQKVPQNALYGKRMFFADTNNGLVWPGDSYDGIHLAATGNTKVGDTWLSVLTPMLPPP
jgi:lysophospholipase L1-like esterase